MKLARSGSAYALIVAAVGAAYANALAAGFQFDDWDVIVDQPSVHSLAAWWGSMPGIRPLLKLSYALNYTISQGPEVFHLVNVLIHAVNACLVFALLTKWGKRSAALASALVFALHPAQTEAVTYVSGRSCSLSAFFVLAGLVAAGWLAPALFACGMLVKETAIVAAVPMALNKRRVTPFVIAAAAVVLGLSVPKYRHLLAVSFQAREIGTNLLTQAHAVVYLMGQLVRFDRLNADPTLPVIDAWSWSIAGEAASIVALVVVGLVLVKKHPEIGYGILWFFLWLLPTNSIVPRLDVVNDRQLYLALAGPAWLAAYGLTALARKRGSILVATVVVVLAIGLGAATHARNRVYADEIAFWSDVAAKSPHNGRAFNNLGYALALAGRDDEAEAAFRAALSIDANDVRAGANLRLLREGALRRDTRGRYSQEP